MTLAWDPSPDASVVGYKLYWGTASRVYSQSIDAGNATTATVSNLVQGTTYYFAATAYDSWGLESDYSAETSYTVPVPVLNYPPTLNSLANMPLPEGAGQQTVDLAGISSGSASENQLLSVTATSSNPALIPHPVVSYVSPNSTGTLTFTPATFLSGSATISVIVNDGGVTNNTVTRNFTVTVFPVNNQPTLAVISDVTVAEDSAPFTVALSGISSGATNETQTLVVTASSSNTGLVPAPTVAYTSPSATGTLTLRPIATKFGSATITVNVSDNGTSNNIVTRTFQLTVTPVNDQPTINAVANLNLTKGVLSQTIALAGIGTGATNETQTLSVTAVSSNPSLIPNPQVNYTSPATTGSLVITPGAATGSAVITVTVNDGGAENSSRSITFTVLVNDPPFISDIQHRAIALGSNMPPVAFTIGDSETPATSLALTAASSNTQLVPTANIIFGGSGSNRTVAISPVAGRTGTALITVTVSDGVSTNFDTFQLAVQQRPAPPGNLQLVVEGLGQVSPNLSGSLVVGQSYSMTALPDANQEFAGWSGSVVSSSPTITFVASTNTQLKAKFIPSPYLPTKGIYSGLFYETNDVRQVSSGYFTFQSSSRGTYSGYLQIGLRKYGFTGKFNLQCLATNTIRRLGLAPLTLKLALANDNSDTVSGELSDGTWTSMLAGDRFTFHSLTNPAPWVGSHTVILAGQEADPALPFGHSYGVLKVASSGIVTLTGKLADGTLVTRTVRLSKNGVLPLYTPLYLGAGSIVSWIGMEDRPTDDLHGEAEWLKPASSSPVYTAGFEFSSDILGSRYIKPAVGLLPVALQSSVIKFSVNGREYENPIELGSTGIVKNLGTNRMAMTISHASGAFKGSVIDPETSQVLPFSGVLLQKQNAGFGMIKTGTTLGRVTVY